MCRRPTELCNPRGSESWRNAGLTDAGLANLAALGELRELHLRGPAITDKSFADLVKLKKLRTLNLTATQVSDAVAAQLKRAVPECHIYGRSGLEVQGFDR